MQDKNAVLMSRFGYTEGYHTDQFESKCQQVLVPLSLPNKYPMSVSPQLHNLSLSLVRINVKFLKAAINI